MNDRTLQLGLQGGQLGPVGAGALGNGHGATQHPGQTSLIVLSLLLLFPFLLFFFFSFSSSFCFFSLLTLVCVLTSPSVLLLTVLPLLLQLAVSCIAIQARSSFRLTLCLHPHVSCYAIDGKFAF